MFEGDASPGDKRPARYTVFTTEDLQQERRLYESELRLACRCRTCGAGGVGGELGELVDPVELARFLQIQAGLEPRTAAVRKSIQDAWSDPQLLRRALLVAISLSAEGPRQSIEMQSPIRSARERLREMGASYVAS